MDEKEREEASCECPREVVTRSSRLRWPLGSHLDEHALGNQDGNQYSNRDGNQALTSMSTRSGQCGRKTRT